MPAPKDWWKTFFNPQTGESMFGPRTQAITAKEVDVVLKRSRTRKSAHVLDLCCGVGRHSIDLARRGFRVTGLDYSKAYLAEAEKSAKRLPRAQRPTFVRGNMADLKSHFEPGSFDLVISLFNSFGYLESRRADLRVLREIHRVLRPGSALVLNTLNEGGVMEKLVPQLASWTEKRPGLFALDRATYDPIERKTHGEWIYIDVKKRKVDRYPLSQNVYSHAELRRELHRIGFRVERVWGRIFEKSFKPNSWHQTFVARKLR